MEHVLDTHCDVCGARSCTVRVRSPRRRPRMPFRGHADDRWPFVYRGLMAGNGAGDTLATGRARALIDVLTPPVAVERIRELDLYDNAGVCRPCGRVYCAAHWNLTDHGSGRCPAGHFAGLDPHWSPDLDD